MFWENILNLCAKNNISPNALCANIGLSNAVATKWKKGSIPHGSTLIKIANYFGVTTEYLLNGPNAQESENKNFASHLEQQTAFSFEGIESDNPLINNSNFEQINELTTISRNLSPEQISLLIAMAKNMQNK